jgi:prepilin-type N-terminal cleavage/methylation domain-containing protein
MTARRQQLKSDNKGFTLVELIIAFAVLAIVVATVSVVIRTTGSTYRSITTDINLQYESQLAMSQLQEYIIDCNGEIAVSGSGDTLYLFNKTGASAYQAYKFSYDGGILYLSAKTMSEEEFLNASEKFSFDGADREPMSSFLTGFSSEVTGKQQDAVQAVSVSVSLTYETGGETCQLGQVIALRNPVVLIPAV